MTVALYRRYRPDTFGEVVGQNHVTDTLKAALDSGRISHAYLFSGPRGCGKTTSARIMARCLNCAQGPTSTPCGECDSCKELAVGGVGSLDVVEIDAASHNGVDDARDLRERAAFAPTRDRYKIFILDEAHMVTAQGFNALLKLVEEPPPHVKFIFATTEPEKVIGTIRSRTHHYPFRLVAPAVLIPYLQQICEKEGITAEEGVLQLVVRAGGGSVRDSLSVLDQLIAGATDGQLSYENSVALLGFTDSALLDGAIDALSSLDGAAVFSAIEQVVGSGHDPRRFVEDLLQRVRDLLICALAPQQAAEILPHIPADQMERMHQQAGAWGTRLLSRRADQIEEALRTMSGATSPRLQLELLMGRLLVGEAPTQEPADSRTLASKTPVTPRTPAPETKSQSRAQSAASSGNFRDTSAAQPESAQAKKEPLSEAPPVSEWRPSRAATPVPQANQATQPNQADQASQDTQGNSVGLEDIARRWEEIAVASSQESAVPGALLRQAKPEKVEGQTIFVAAVGAANRLRQGTPDHERVQKGVQQILGPGWSIQVSGDAPTQTATASQAIKPSSGPQANTLPDLSASEPTKSFAPVNKPAQSPGWGPVAIPGGNTSSFPSTQASPLAPEPTQKRQTGSAQSIARSSAAPQTSQSVKADNERQESDSKTFAATKRESPVQNQQEQPAEPEDGYIPPEVPFDSSGVQDEPSQSTLQANPQTTSQLTPLGAVEEEWGDAASLDDDNIAGPAHLGLPTLLEVLGGTVIEEITGEER